MNTNTTKVIVPCRFSYLHCWEPAAVNGGEPKYSVSAIIDKKDTKTINAIKAAIEQAKKDSVSKWGGKVPANLHLPLRDGDIDRPDDEPTLAATSSTPTAVRLPGRGCQGSAYPRPERSVLRLLRQNQRDLLWLQCQRQSRHRRWSGKYPEAERWREPGRSLQR